MIALAGPGLAQRDDAATSRPEIVELLTGKVVYDDGSPAVACTLVAKGPPLRAGAREPWITLETEGPRADGTFVVRGPRGVREDDIVVVPSYGDGYRDWKAPYGRSSDFYRKPVKVGRAPGTLQGRVLLDGLPPEAVEIVYETSADLRAPRAVVRPSLAGLFSFRALPPSAGRIAVRLHGAVQERLDLLIVDDVSVPRDGAVVTMPDLDLAGRYVRARIEVRDAEGRPVDGVTAAVHASREAIRDEAVFFPVTNGVADVFAPKFPFCVYYSPGESGAATWFADVFHCSGPTQVHTLRPRCVLRSAAVEDEEIANGGLRLVPELLTKYRLQPGFPARVVASEAEFGVSLLKIACDGSYVVYWRLVYPSGTPLGDDAIWTDSEVVNVGRESSDAYLTVRPSLALLSKARARAAR